jgi:hypothetical protein
MKNFQKFAFVFLSIHMTITIWGQGDRKIEIKSGVKYNTSMGYFEFNTNKDFNDYLIEIEKQTKSIIEDKKEEYYTLLSRRYRHTSIRNLINEKVNQQLSSGEWTPESDVDNYFIQDDAFRFLLNKFGEVVVANKYILFIDKCELITFPESEKEKIIKLRNSIPDVFKINKLKIKSISATLNYCEDNPTSNNKEIEDCCDKNDRDKFKYLEYANGTRKVKAVFWQRNIWWLSYNRVGGRTINYKKKNNGKWGLEKADNISIHYGGTIYSEAEDGTDCSDSHQFGTWGDVETNKNNADSSWPIGSTFWYKKCSLASIHYVSDNSGHATIMLYLSVDCGDCEVYAAIGSDVSGVSNKWQVSYSSNTAWNIIGTSGYQLPNLLIGKFDNDNKTDVFVTNGTQWMYAASTNSFNWVTFASSVVTINQIKLADFDGDSKSDVFYPTGTEWRIAKSADNYNWHTIASSAVTLNQLALADFDGDSKADVFYPTGTEWRIAKSTDNYNWYTIASSRTTLNQVALADFDGDSKADVFYPTGTEWKVARSTDNYNWHTIGASGYTLSNLLIGKFDSDNKADILLATGSEWKLAKSTDNYNWSFSATSGYKIPNIVLGDFNGDNISDVFRSN